MSNKLYAERDIDGLDEDGNFYFKHVMAMTAESLHGKSAIAAELGYRDSRIVELQARLEHAVSQRDNALAQVEQLNGIKPELPPRPPQGDGLLRYGIKWNGDRQPISTPMDDGYWTPYHLALAQNAELVAQVGGLRQGLIDARKWVDERNNVCDKSKDFCDTLTLLIEATPAQHLRDRDAEVGRAGFVAGLNYPDKVYFQDATSDPNLAADQYAEKVRRGEV